jgi:hypothetical protein
MGALDADKYLAEWYSIVFNSCLEASCPRLCDAFSSFCNRRLDVRILLATENFSGHLSEENTILYVRSINIICL